MEDKTLKNGEQMQAYSEALQTGLYAKKTGLIGKYDNVRRYWEDEVTRRFLRPHLIRLLKRSQTRMRRFRILDLGCGGADGFELLIGIRQRDADLREVEVDILTPDVLGLYKGIDLNEDLLEQARDVYGHNPKLIFEKGDFSDGLPIPKNEKPYDLYFTSYGTCSHFNEDEGMIALLADIAARTENYCIIMCDWLGRYSYEWQTLWSRDLTEDRNMDYVVSYIYEKEEREKKRGELQHLYLRLMSRGEAEDIIAEASERAGVQIRPLAFFDRSIFTGRHMDTGDYNPYARPMRRAVNSLHEVAIRTDLSTLKLDYIPKPGFDELNRYFENLQVCWNLLVEYSDHLLKSYDTQKKRFTNGLPEIPPDSPPPLREVLDRMKRVVEGVGWLDVGLPRENIIEPQLGYALRYLTSSLQQGQGCSHSLVGILEVDKTKG